jgi:hypothetical protein
MDFVSAILLAPLEFSAALLAWTYVAALCKTARATAADALPVLLHMLTGVLLGVGMAALRWSYVPAALISFGGAGVVILARILPRVRQRDRALVLRLYESVRDIEEHQTLNKILALTGGGLLVISLLSTSTNLAFFLALAAGVILDQTFTGALYARWRTITATSIG